MSVAAIAEQYVNLCKAGKFDDALELFAENAVSVEAFAPPGVGSRESVGLAAIRAKGDWWAQNHTIHSIRVTGPYPNANRFAVRFELDVTQKSSQQRIQMDEIGLFTVENGKITREEFFYSGG